MEENSKCPPLTLLRAPPRYGGSSAASAFCMPRAKMHVAGGKISFILIFKLIYLCARGL